MTSSFGGPGGKPGETPPNQPFRRPGTSSSRPNSSKPPGAYPQAGKPPTQTQEPVIKPVRIEIGKRIVALIIDVTAGYILAIIVRMIPLLNKFFPLELTIIIYLLIRDYFFEGRGIGKNVLGLQVVDIYTGKPCSLLQACKRNSVLLIPLVVLQGISLILRLAPIPWLSTLLLGLGNLIGLLYCILVLPIEIYKSLSRQDGIRFGDQWAGTTIVEANTDFRNILPPD